MKLNIRNKLIVFAVLAIIVPLGISATIILFQLTGYTSQRSEERIQSDARVAKTIFDKRQENLRVAAQSIAQTIAGRGVGRAATTPAEGDAAQTAAPAAPSNTAMQSTLKAQLEANKVSFVVLLDPKGKVIAQHNGPASGDGNQFADNAFFKTVINRAQAGAPEVASGLGLEPEAVLTATGLKEKASVKGFQDGLFLEAAAPVQSGDSVQGVVLVGQLVNNDNSVNSDTQQSIVNEIKETVYRDIREDAGVIIAAVQGNDNVVISTNLQAGQGGGAATGEKVVDAGGSYEEPSLNKATFGGITYYTSFVPIQSVDQQGGAKTIGRIGVAIKEDWFTAIVRRVQLTILVVSLLALILAIVGAVVAAQRLTRPIEELTEAANRISLGELDVPINVKTGDEIETLGESLDRMRISLKQAIERLRKR